MLVNSQSWQSSRHLPAQTHPATHTHEQTNGYNTLVNLSAQYMDMYIPSQATQQTEVMEWNSEPLNQP